MSACYFRNYFANVGSYCIPPGFHKTLKNESAKELARSYEIIKWSDLADDQTRIFLTDIMRALGNSSSEGEPWIHRSANVLFMNIKYKLSSDHKEIFWSEISESFRLKKIISAWEAERDPVRKSIIYELLDFFPGWPYAPDLCREQFGWICASVASQLAMLSHYSERQMHDLLLALRGARRLGGDSRLLRALKEMFDALEGYPCLWEPVLSIVAGNFDRKLYWKSLPLWAKGQILEVDLGM